MPFVCSVLSLMSNQSTVLLVWTQNFICTLWRKFGQIWCHYDIQGGETVFLQLLRSPWYWKTIAVRSTNFNVFNELFAKKDHKSKMPHHYQRGKTPEHPSMSIMSEFSHLLGCSWVLLLVFGRLSRVFGRLSMSRAPKHVKIWSLMRNIFVYFRESGEWKENPWIDITGINLYARRFNFYGLFESNKHILVSIIIPGYSVYIGYFNLINTLKMRYGIELAKNTYAGAQVGGLGNYAHAWALGQCFLCLIVEHRRPILMLGS